MLIDQVFAGFFMYERIYPKYAKKTRDHYRDQSFRAMLFSFSPKILWTRPAKYVFAGNIAYFSDVLALSENENAAILTTGVRTHLKALKAGKNSHFVIDLYHGLHEYLDAPRDAERKIRQNVARLSRILKKLQPSFLFVQSDTMPFEREIILAARKSGITTICVQHGIFNRETPRELTEGKFADIFLAYDEEQAKIVKEGSTACRVLVSGSLKRNSPRLAEVQDKYIVFLGQPYPLLLDEEKAAFYIDLVKEIANRCQEVGLRLLYKPHPGELGSAYLKDLPELLSGSIETVFERFQHFLGISSTTLHQASIRGKTAVQIIHPMLNAESFSDLGYCYTYTWQALDELFANIKKLPPYTSTNLNGFESGELSSRWDRLKALLEGVDNKVGTEVPREN